MPISSSVKLELRTNTDSSNLALKTQQQSQCLRCSTYRVCPAAAMANGMPINHFDNTFHSHKLSTGEHICHAGETIQAIYIVKSGMFKTYLTTECGDERVINFYLPGEVFGVDAIAEGKHVVSAMAVETSSVCAILVSDFEKQITGFASNWLIKQACQGILRERQSFLISSSKHRADAKMALFLLDLSERHRMQGYSFRSFKLNMPRRDLANHLDLALETISRVMTRLQEANIIELNNRIMTITNFNGLLMVAGTESPDYMLHYN